MNNVKIKNSTIRAISRFLKILCDTDVVGVQEMNEINSQLKSIYERGTLRPTTPNKLLDRNELSLLLSVSVSTLKRLEKTGDIDIPILRIGSTLRYRLHDVHAFLDSLGGEED